jgi:hypothetical protein
MVRKMMKPPSLVEASSMNTPLIAGFSNATKNDLKAKDGRIKSGRLSHHDIVCSS